MIWSVPRQRPRYDCADCGVHTITIGEYYRLDDALWTMIAPLVGQPWSMLCIGCVEGRLGRRLVPADFPVVPCNDPSRSGMSVRLRARITGNLPLWLLLCRVQEAV